MEILRDKKRDWDLLREADKIQYILRDKLRSKPFYLKGSEPPVEFIMGNILPEGIEFFTIPEQSPQTQVTLYLTLNRHIEVDFEVQNIQDDRWLLMPTLARIGKVVRAHPRFAMAEGSVYATNFKVSKNELGADIARLQIAAQVVLRDQEKQLAEEFPGLRMFLTADRDRPLGLRPIEHMTETLVIKDTNDPHAYEIPVGDTTYFKLLGKTFEQVRLKLGDTASLVIYPIALEEKGKKYLIAHMYLPLKHTGTDFDALLKTLSEKAELIIERIREVNMVTIKEKQKVRDISLGGVGIEIDNSDLKKYLPVSDRITFDLIFKMQAPLRFQGKICHVAAVGDQTLLAGIDIEGTGHTEYRKSNQERLGTLIQLIRSESK